jgi:pimeloyl-ACP methyl ester carboxylesterase
MLRVAVVFVIVAVAMFAGYFAGVNLKVQEQKRQEETATQLPQIVKSGHVEANGIDYYYRIYGSGKPLLILHGGLSQMEMFEPTLPKLTKERQVIAVDLYGHGRTALGDSDRPINPSDMGDDMAIIIEKLGYKNIDVLGDSLGGSTAIRLAVQHPEVVRCLIVVSTTYAWDGWYPEMLPQQTALNAGQAESMKELSSYRAYAAVAPNPEEFPKLLDRMGEYFRTRYDWSADVATLRMPVMLMYGDSDMIKYEHITDFYQLLGGGLRDAGWQREHMPQNRLAILPDRTHYDVLLSPQFSETVLSFLD